MTRLSPDKVDASNLPLSLTMDVLVSGGTKRKNGAAQGNAKSAKKPRTKKSAPAPTETDDESEADESRSSSRRGQVQDESDVDEDELEAWEAALGADASSDGGMDENGWASVKTSRKPSAGGVDVLELD